MLHRTQEGPVTLLRLDDGKVNALDVDLLDALSDMFEELVTVGAGAVVLTGNGRVFSAGVDLYRVLDGGADYAADLIRALDRAFRTLLDLPLPLVTAVDGAAIAGGCILACAGDHRLIGAGRGPIGITELRVGVPFPASALELVRFAAGDAVTSRLALLADTYGAEEARDLGLVDEVVPAGDLVERSLEVAGRLAAVPRETFRLTKAQLRRPSRERVAAYRIDVDERVSEVWASPDSAAAIRRFMEQVVGR
jgi:enoyl-CoA hydratase